jgi:hypothetical protein
MIWGIRISPGECYKIAALKYKTEILKLTRAFIDPNSTGTVSLFVEYENNNLLIARLNPEKPFKDLDLFASTDQNLIFFTEGENSVSMLGYLEPIEELEDDQPSQIMQRYSERSNKKQIDESSDSEEVIIPPKFAKKK